MTSLLEIKNQHIGFLTPRGLLIAVNDVSLRIEQGETVGIVGESGSGKSVLSRSILQLLPQHAHIGANARVLFDGQDLSGLNESALRQLRGPAIAMIFQDPMTALNPVMTIGLQVSEGMRIHLGMSRRQAWRRAVELLDRVGLPQPEVRAKQYPHELSGGMRQRVAIAIALACEPRLLIADEPTTALDVTVQAEILDLLQREQRERNMAMILITHDLGVVAGRTDRIAVMYAGQIVEQAPTPALFNETQMPYTQALLGSVPTIDDMAGRRLDVIDGRPPDLVDAPQGCAFAPRCQYMQSQCTQERPVLAGNESQQAACWFPLGRIIQS